jgi:3-dehydroquinate synthase
MSLPDHIVLEAEPAAWLADFFSHNEYSQIVVLADRHTQSLCYPLVKDALPPHSLFAIQPGEEHKTLATCTQIWEFLTNQAIDRHGLVVIIGGGVLGDMGGFCAATYKRGIDFLLLPTTLLAQVDASIGGKLGIDFAHLKNHIGVFKEPRCTLISPAFLGTLPERELRSGFAEIIKHALIANATLWENLANEPDWRNHNWLPLVRTSVEIKHRVVAQDPTERGLRKVLNFGHTVGHAIESAALETGDSLLHGEAIAIGMICEAFLSSEKGLLPKTSTETISRYLLSVYPKVALPQRSRVLELIQQDKKNKGKKTLAALLKGIGQAVWDVEISEAEVVGSMDYYQRL